MPRKVEVKIVGYYELPDYLQASYDTDDPDAALEVDLREFNDDPWAALDVITAGGVVEVRVELADV